MNDLRYPEWQKPYQEALLESDNQKLRAKILFAEWKIYQRMEAISTNGDHYQERSEIADALDRLLALKFDRLNYPDWNHNRSPDISSGERNTSGG
jgi:hypothetical protein